MSRYREQVLAALAAVSVCGPTQYKWLGSRSRRLPATLHGAMEGAEQRRYLVTCLREELYFSFYCHGEPVLARWGQPEPASADPWLLDALSRANTGRGRWEPGWSVERVIDGQAVALGPSLRLRVPVSDCRGEVRAGSTVAVRMPNERPMLSPGFWTVLGDAVPGASSRPGDVRVYWNVTYSGAAALVRAITSELNEREVPFQFKVADHPFRLDRCDAAVLYLSGEDFLGIRDALAGLAARLAEHLQPAIPAFTLELAPGVGLAEDPDGASFGGRRCALLADAIVRAHERGLSRSRERLDAVVGRFAEDGVAIDAPYLEPALDSCHVL